MKNLVVNMGIGLLHIVAILPLSWARKLGTTFGWLLWITNSPAAKVTKINLGICFPNMGEDERRTLAKKSLISQGLSYAELGMTCTWPIEKAHKLITQVQGMEYLQKALDDKKGIIIIGPHLGNWEMLLHFFSKYVEPTVMYKPARIAALDSFIYKTRARVSIELVSADSRGVIKLYKKIKASGVVGVLPDQEPTRDTGVFAPFFGQTALTGKLTGEMASRTSGALICCYAKRLDDGNYCVVLKPAHEDIRSKDPVVAATALNASIEECILDCPEQYQWGYKRFRRLPTGRSTFYK